MDVFVKVLNGEFTFEDDVHERKWLTVTAINYCKDKLKSWKHKAVDYLDDVTEPAAEEKDDHSEVLEAVRKRTSSSHGLKTKHTIVLPTLKAAMLTRSEKYTLF